MLFRLLRAIKHHRRNTRLRAIRHSFGSIGLSVELSETLHIQWPDRVHLGSYVYIGPWVQIYGRGGLRIQNNVMIAPEVLIMTSMHNYKGATMVPYDNVELLRPVVLHNNVWLGQRCIIMPGVELGEGVIVATGAVVTKSYSSGTIVGGNPAKPIGHRDMVEYQDRVTHDKLFLKHARQLGLKKEDKFDC
ncbi:MAG TPA: acyltransferase [Clostridia bacterium]|nr:acyltransferase [Clostridia bacterium]